MQQGLRDETRLDPAHFRSFVDLNLALDRIIEPGPRRAALGSLVAAADELLVLEPRDLLARWPKLVAETMADFGWLWNGFYALRGDDTSTLHVSHAFGPPVCSSLDRTGGPLSSGMCFDGILLNQILVAYDTKSWPGYVSCDASSGLSTVSGIVCPIRDPRSRAIAVWDLDATQKVHPADARTMDVLLTTLARVKVFSQECFTS